MSKRMSFTVEGSIQHSGVAVPGKTNVYHVVIEGEVQTTGSQDAEIAQMVGIHDLVRASKMSKVLATYTPDQLVEHLAQYPPWCVREMIDRLEHAVKRAEEVQDEG